MDNFKKRTARDREESDSLCQRNLASKILLPVIDNLERAIGHASSGGNGKLLVEGVEMVLKGFLDVLAKHGVRPVAAVGLAFDPAQHEAMAQVESRRTSAQHRCRRASQRLFDARPTSCGQPW